MDGQSSHNVTLALETDREKCATIVLVCLFPQMFVFCFVQIVYFKVDCDFLLDYTDLTSL